MDLWKTDTRSMKVSKVENKVFPYIRQFFFKILASSANYFVSYLLPQCFHLYLWIRLSTDTTKTLEKRIKINLF